METEETPDRLKTWACVLISLAAVTGALVSWQATRTSARASGSDGQAITAALEEAGVEITIASDLYASRTNAAQFRLGLESGRTLRSQAKSNPAVPGRWLDDWQSEIIRARIHHSQLNPDYLKNEGGLDAFDERKYRDAVRAAAAGQKALDPEPFIRQAALLRRDARILISLNIVFSAAIFLLTAALQARPGRKMPWIAAGAAFYLTGAAWAAVRLVF